MYKFTRYTPVFSILLIGAFLFGLSGQALAAPLTAAQESPALQPSATGASTVSQQFLPLANEMLPSTEGAALLPAVSQDDGAALQHPLPVNSLVTGVPDWVAETNETETWFGWVAATAGDVNGDGYDDVIVSQDMHSDIYLYQGSALGLSTSPVWSGFAGGGASIATAGDVNGDGYADVIAGEASTAVVYYGSASGLGSDYGWEASGAQPNGWFGMSVNTAGDVNGDGYDDVIIGEPGYNIGAGFEGRAYVYYGSASGLNDTPAWVVDGEIGFKEFGIAVDTAGDVNGDGYADVVVGADLPYTYPGDGKVFVYHGSASGLSISPDWTAQGDENGAEFGAAVSTAGDVNDDGYDDLIIGANGYGFGVGKADVYYGSASGLASDPGWEVVGEQNKRGFGRVVNAAGDVNRDGYADIIVSVWGYSNGQTKEGGVFIYYGSVSGLNITETWILESNQADAWFGFAAGGAGDVNGDNCADVIVGAPWYDNGQTNEGRAYVFHGVPSSTASIPDWTAEGDLESARFGASVSTAGDVNGDGYTDALTLASNANDPGGQEWVSLFYGSALGLGASPVWTAEAWGGASVGTAGDVNGDGYADIIIGAPGEDQIFAYYGSASGLGDTEDWIVTGDQSGAMFGISVSTAGDVNGDGYSDVIVGASNYSNDQTLEGRAYIYYGSAGGLSAAPAWMVEGDQADAYLGQSVSTAGDVNGDGYADVIAGVYGYSNDQAQEGRAYIYYGSAAGVSAVPDWTVEGNQAGAQLGGAVGAAGDVNGDGYADVIISAPGYSNGQEGEGRVLLYSGSAGGVSAAPDWAAESDQAMATMGVYRVGTAGDVNGDGYADVIISAFWYDNEQQDEGRAYIYHGSVSGLSANPVWLEESNQAHAEFGASVDTAGDVNGDGYADVIIGAPGYSNGQSEEGRAYVFHGGPDAVSTTAGWITGGERGSTLHGTGVSTAGDVNGDGYADVIVGAPYYDNGQTNEGQVSVYYGAANGLANTPDWTVESNQAESRFGWSVSTAGDVNGDGYSDVIVGALRYDNNGLTDDGRVFVYHGSATGLSTNPAWTVEGGQTGAYLGFSVDTAGDVNGDGYADVIIGAYGYDNGEVDEGRVYVYLGSTSGLKASPNWTGEIDQAGANFGYSVGAAGDIDRDGYDDVIVGAPLYDFGYTNQGMVSVYRGSSSGIVAFPDWATPGVDQTEARFGISVNTAGDVNGDGYADVIVGADGYDNGQTNEGRAYVYRGTATGINDIPYWIVESDQAGAWLGGSVSTAGDVNGDGYADVIVGAFWYGNNQNDEGHAFIYHGSASGMSTIPDWTGESNQASAEYGYSVSTAGDVNGDGYADIVVGARRYDLPGYADNGQAYLYYGNGRAGVGMGAQARHVDNSSPIVQGGRSDLSNAFRLAVLGRTPFGRGKVKLEWEVKPRGTRFDGTSLQSSTAWLDSGTAGVALDELVSGLSANTAYHWRLRLRYHPATMPWQQYSRWITPPWNGWNEADFRTTPVAPELALSKSVQPASALPSAPITYTLSFNNRGLSTATGTTLTDILPPELVVVSVESWQPIIDILPGPGYIWQLPNLAPGTSGTITIHAVLSDTLPVGLTIPNTARIAASGEVYLVNNQADVTLTVLNAAPLALDDRGAGFTTDEDTPFTSGNVLLNDLDANGDPLGIVQVDASSLLGRLTDRGDGSFDYDPDGQFESLPAGATAYETFTYTLSDGELSDTAVVTLTIQGVNDAPLVQGESLEILEDSAGHVLPVLQNDSDIDGGVLGLSDAGAPDQGGTLIYDSSTLTYTPAADFYGVEVFTYTVSDSQGGFATAAVTVTLAPVNDAPSFTGGASQMAPEDAGAQLVSGWASAISPGPANESGQALTFTLSTDNPGLFAAAPALVASSGDLSFTPAPDLHGTAHVTVTLQDDSGTQDGGDDLSAAHFFTITVSSVNDAPELAVIGDRAVDELTPLFFTASASDSHDTPPGALSFSLGSGAPAGVGLDPATGAFAWTPDESQGPGVYPITVTVTDDGAPNLSDTQIFTVTVAEANLAPELAAIGNQAVDELNPLAFTLSASDGDLPANTLSFSLESGAPAGVGLDPATGAFAWTPDESQGPGVYPITVTVTDNGAPNLSDTQTFTITVAEINLAPELAAISDQSASEGTPLTLTLSAGDGDLPANTLSFSLGSGAPAGASLDPASGAFAWTPDESQGPGVYPITVTVTDNGAPNLSDTQIFTVTVAEANLAPELAVISNQSVSEGLPLTMTLSASDSDLPTNTLSFSLGSGAPAGASLDPVSGAFAWTPDESQGPGVYPITVVVTDDGAPNLSDAQTFTVTVAEINLAPELAVISDQSVSEGLPLTMTLSASDSDLPTNTLSFSLGSGAPAGASLDPASGAFAWTPDEGQGPGVYPITVTVTDDGAPNLSDAQTFTVTVAEANQAPELAAIGDQAVDELNLLAFTLSASDSDLPANTLSFSLGSGAPAGASLDPVSGAFAWTPDESQGPGVYPITVVVTDDGAPNLSEAQTFTVTVAEANLAPELAAISDQSVSEGLPLTMTLSASDGDLPTNTLSFSLGSGAPAGASLDPASGAFAWTPDEGQGPGVYPITVTVTDDGAPNLSDAQTFTVTVAEANQAPELAAIGDQAVDELNLLAFTLSASDSDLPANTLSFSLGSGAPAGASLDPVSGAFAWTPDESQGLGVYPVTVMVTDNGAPNLSDIQTFTVTVAEVNLAPQVSAGADGSALEGQEVLFSGGFIDPGLLQSLDGSQASRVMQGAALHWDFGDGLTASGTLTPTHLYADDGVYTVTLTVTDSLGLASQDMLCMFIANVSPELGDLLNRSVEVGEIFTFTTGFDDPGLLDTHSASIDWGDGQVEVLDVDQMAKLLDGVHTYQSAGVYTVMLRLFDDDGGQVVRTFTVTVNGAGQIYLPFVTK